MKTHYDVLGVNQTASMEEIAAKYRLLQQMQHPDRFASDERQCREANRLSQELNAAYQVLGNPVKRAEYDRSLRPQKTASVTSKPGSRPGPVRQSEYDAAYRRDFEEYWRKRAQRVGRYRVEDQPPQQVATIQTPLDLVAFALRPFGWIGVGIWWLSMILRNAGLLSLILAIPSFVVAFILMLNDVVSPAMVTWAAWFVSVSFQTAVGAMVLLIVPLVWAIQFCIDQPKIVLCFVGAVVMAASITIFVRVTKNALGLRPWRISLFRSSAYWAEHMGPHTAYGIIFVAAVTYGILVHGGVPPGIR